MPQILPVLLGGDANVYGMARSFYETYGVRSLAVCRRALPALAHSRIVQVAAQDPAFERDRVFTATLLGLAEQYPGRTRLLISCADGYTQLMVRCAAELRGTYRFACPPPAALALADKQQFAAACRAVGLRTPQSITVYPGLDKAIEGYGGNVAAATAVGKLVAERAKAKGIENVVFDRGGYLYHGRVQALAEGAREGGLKF